jgi:molybdate transport system ATP-binding protein
LGIVLAPFAIDIIAGSDVKPNERTLIELSHCSLILDNQPVLDDVSFKLRQGERWALVGPNGSGKTLLLKMLRGDVWPTPTGQERRSYALDGRASRDPAGSKERIAYVGPERQDKYVRYGWNLSVLSVVTTGLFDEDIPLTRPTRAQQARVGRVLKRFGLWGLRTRHMLTLSYGQRRLVLVARAFVSEAPVLLLDEVFNGLDAKTRAKLQRALEAPKAGHAWVLTTHRAKELPGNITHLAYVRHGQILHAGPASALHDKTARVPELTPRNVVTRAVKARGKAKTTRRTRAKRSESWLVRIRDVNLYRDYRPVIRDLHWTLLRGEHWAILGANGSGKSTILSLIYGDLHPELGGHIERHGAPAGTRIEQWKRRVGWISPELQADHYLAKSLEEIVISGRYSSVGLNEPPSAADRKAAKPWLEFFGLASFAQRGPRQVSYGQMRLALFARAMINNPDLLLLDEPCTGLDGDVRTHVLELLQDLATRGTQIVMAVHDPEDIIPAVTKVLKIGRGGRVEIGERGAHHFSLGRGRERSGG